MSTAIQLRLEQPGVAPVQIELVPRTARRHGLEVWWLEAWSAGTNLVTTPEHMSLAGATTWFHTWLVRYAEEQRKASLH